MNKLALNADDLRVDSFPTSRQPAERGTVDAHGEVHEEVVSQGGESCYCTSVNIGCWCSERETCWNCV
jgi:hypothetical protein